MDIITNTHFKVINEINRVTDFSVCYGGSLEDYLNLGYSTKPIGDLDVLIYDKSLIGILSKQYELTEPKPSYFNHFMGEKFTKYNTFIEGIKIDFLVSDYDYDENLFIETVINGEVIRHRNFQYKIQILKEWIEQSYPNDMWAHEKFSNILKKYEDINNK